jgi:hypothetical protein
MVLPDIVEKAAMPDHLLQRGSGVSCLPNQLDGSRLIKHGESGNLKFVMSRTRSIEDLEEVDFNKALFVAFRASYLVSLVGPPPTVLAA